METKITRRDFARSASAAALPALARRPSGAMLQPLLAYRIAPAQWETDEQFSRLLAFVKAERAAVDEISLFDEAYPRPAATPLDRLEPVAVLLERRIEQLRAAGIGSVGINVTYTLGHGDVRGGFLGKLNVPSAVGHDGRKSISCVCPNSAPFRAYIKSRYARMARAKPDFIWVDDDFRMSHHGPTYPCFCHICLERFGRERDRAALVASLNAPENGALRRAWTEFCAASLESLAADIRQAVEQVDANIELGLMTIAYSHSTYAGYQIGRWMQALNARRGRPGSGYYTDETPRRYLHKALDAGRQVRDYPSGLRAILYEQENYPYIVLDKAAQTVLNESVAAFMMGCNGIAFNVLKECAGPLEEYRPVLGAIASQRPVWNALVEACRGLPLAGFWPSDDPLLMTDRNVDAKGWFREGRPYDILRPDQAAEVGLAFTPDRKSACGILLAGKVAEAFSDEELRAMLSGAVLMDGEALEVLWARGLGELSGVRPGERFPTGVTERLTNHPLNGRYAGDGREALIGPADSVFNLEAAGKEVAVLARLLRYDGADCGACFTLYTNPLKGRVAVSTYAPWSCLGRAGKRAQLLAAADWLSAGRLPAIINETVRVAPLIRTDGRRVAMLLLNLSLDPTGPLTLRLRAKPRRASLLTIEGPKPLPLREGRNEVVVEAPSIPAWRTAALVGD